MGQTASAPITFGDEIDVRTGFVRVTIPAGEPAPRAEELEVVWKGCSQPVLRVLGGADDPLEVGIAVDRSASMHAAFEPMRAAALALVDQGISDADRVFVVGFADEIELLAEGRGSARLVLAALPARPETGPRPTALWRSLGEVLDRFGNADARAALIVVSDGCDTFDGGGAPLEVVRRANDLAIPIFLLMPGRGECRNITCVTDAAGEWRCADVSPPNLDYLPASGGSRVESLSVSFSQDYPAAVSTNERDRFMGLIAQSGGGGFSVDDPREWQRAWTAIFERLGRQWTVVFAPTSDEVKSEEIKVYRRTSGRRQRLR
ncbi:MAG: vWA domain-containing protein [Thermoanaerobaculia bacterium]